MARDIRSRNSNLKSRRLGLDRTGRLSLDASTEVLAKRFLSESYSNRSAENSYTRYALGAMQEVGPEYTKISIDEAGRVGRHLAYACDEAGIAQMFRLQGSVPANVHIRGVSDVDLLVIDNRFFTYDDNGLRARSGQFSSPVAYTPLSALQALRKLSEKALVAGFPAADVDTSGSKAIKISKGSLKRPVDVVPSHWHDTIAFQQSNDERDRGICILDRDCAQRVLNHPFKHMHLLAQRDILSNGGLKMAIRLCKNVKADAIEEGSKIDLSSFDIAAAMWHADMNALRTLPGSELAVLAETQRHLDYLASNHEVAKLLLVPDGSRPIFDLVGKLTALNTLSTEMDDLAIEVAREQSKEYLFGNWTHQSAREGLRRAYIP